MKKGKVDKYIESIKDPRKFLEYCKKFHEEEPRDIAYVVSRDIISKDPSNINFVLASAVIIITTWNTARFQRLPREVKVKLKNDIIDAYMKTKEELEKLRGKRLESLNLNDSEIRETIKKIFQEFSSKKSIDSTGASKILHILNPCVFMMWDRGIREAYHKLHNKDHKVGDSECYLEFLKQSQEIIKGILQEKGEEDIWNEHLTSLDEVNKDFMMAFSFRENMLKMLDECNYVMFRLNIKL